MSDDSILAYSILSTYLFIFLFGVPIYVTLVFY